jgi:hypothetical protein
MRASDESTKLLPNKNKKKQKKIQAFDSITSQSWITIYRTSFFLYVWHPMAAAAIENGCRRDTCNIGRFIHFDLRLSTVSWWWYSPVYLLISRNVCVYYCVAIRNVNLSSPSSYHLNFDSFFSTIFIFSSPHRPIILLDLVCTSYGRPSSFAI